MENLYDIPQSWKWTVIEGMGKIYSGGTPKTADASNFDGEVAWITPADLTDYTAEYISRGRRNISQKGLNSSSAKLMPEGTVLFSSRAPIGYVAITSNPVCTNQGFKNVKPGCGIESRFVYYYLKSAKKLAESRASGTTFRELSGSRFAKLPIPIAPLNEQKRIVEKIEELFSKIDAGEAALKKAQALIKQYRQSLLKAAVTGELTREWREKNKGKIEPAHKLLERILEARRGAFNGKRNYTEPNLPNYDHDINLPETWMWASVDQLSSLVQYGSSAKCNNDENGIPVLRMGNIQSGQLDITNLKYLPHNHEEFPDLFLDEGDLLFNRTNSAELVGKVAIYDLNFTKCSFASYLIRVKFIHVNPYFFAYFLNSTFCRKWVAKVQSQQVGQANVNGTKLKGLAVPLPPLEEQNKIVEIVESINEISNHMLGDLNSRILQSLSLRQSILKSAFSGQLVEQDPADEPASVLLECIKAEREKTNPSATSKTPKAQKRKKAA